MYNINSSMQFMTFLCVKLSSFHKDDNIFFYQCSKSICPLSGFSYFYIVYTKRISFLKTCEVIKNKGHCLDMNNNICVCSFFNKIYRSIFPQNGFLQLVLENGDMCVMYQHLLKHSVAWSNTKLAKVVITLNPNQSNFSNIFADSYH